MTDQDKPRGELTVRISAMPADTNANGDIFGGWVLSRMDQAGGIAGVERAKGRVVTVAIDGMAFLNPVRVGDTVACYAWLEKIGRTSMKICVDVWVMRYRTGDRVKVTSGVFTYVALGPDGKPTPVQHE